MKHLPINRQRGIALIESLVAMVVVALGILGVIGVQMRTLTDTTTSVRRAQAIRLIEDLGERMKTSPNAAGNIAAYVSAFSDVPAVVSCAAGCDSAQLAAYDVLVWKKSIASALPLGQASIFVPPAESPPVAGQGRQLGVMVAWRENEGDGLNTADIDASIGGGTGATCPSGFTCHLQYLPVIGRCAPYAPGSNTTSYYCAGP